jgi:RND family efflux transporter MFP subunit
MTNESRISLNRRVAAGAALGLVLVGAGATYVGLRLGRADGERDATMQAGAAQRQESAAISGSGHAAETTGTDAGLPDVQVTLTEEGTARAGIVVEPVARGTSALDLRLPAVVEPNAYRQVVVTPLVGGRVIRVSAELGDGVRRGETMAQIYSPPLAEAQTRYVSARAMLDAHDRELQRTEKLVEIGSASRQELERIHAEHASQTAAVQTARAELELLGLPPAAIAALDSGKSVDATSDVPAPLDGVVTERAANIGLNVDPSTKLFTVIDLASVWVVGEVYERDFSRVRVGSAAVVTTPAYPNLTLRGRVSYIDPQVSPATRTAKLRVEVPNPRGDLRLGMYAEVAITGDSASSVVLIPRTAVQNVGSRAVVYLASVKEPGRFTEREVVLGGGSGDRVEVTGGVQPGDRVVTHGSFALRAERERLGLRPRSGTSPNSPAPAAGADQSEGAVQSVRVAVTEQGFDPVRLTLQAGVPARLIVTRTTDNTCGTEIAVPSLGVKRALPLDTPVTIDFTPAKAGEIAFACGMNMLKGVIVVQ